MPHFSDETYNVAALCIFRKSATVVLANCHDAQAPWPEFSVLESREIENIQSAGLEHTFTEAGRIIEEINDRKSLKRLAISCFGPFENLNSEIHLNKNYGQISELQTDLGANGKNLVELARQFIQCKLEEDVLVTTDVNALALGELYLRAKGRLYPFNEYTKFKDTDENMRKAFNRATVVGLAFGKGVGGGIALGGGQVWQQHYHPEMGHIPVSRLPGDDREGQCPVHNDCITGFVSRKSLLVNGSIPKENWELFHKYAAHLVATVTYVLCPDIVTLSGSLIKENPSALDGIYLELDELFRNRRPDESRHYVRQESDALFKGYLSLADAKSQIVGTLVFGASSVLPGILRRNKSAGGVHDRV